MVRKRSFNKRRLAWSWLLTYISILLIPIISSLLLFVSYQRILRDEITRSNEGLLSVTKQNIDQQLDELKSIGFQLGLNPRHARFLNITGGIRPTDRMNLYELAKDMPSYLSIVDDFVTELYIYYENTTSYVGPSRHYSSALFYEMHIAPAGISETVWNDIIEDDHVHALKRFTDQNGQQGTLYYLHTMRDYRSSGRHTVVASIDIAKLGLGERSTTNPDMSSLLIMDQNSLLLNTSPEFELNAQEEQYLSQMVDSEEMTIQGQDYMVSLMRSDSIDIQYLVLTPSDIYWEAATRSVSVIVGAAIASLTFGIIFIIFVFKRQYSPVKSLMEYLMTQDLELTHAETNELDYIRSSVETALESKNTIEDRLEAQNRQLRQTMMNRLLRGNVDTEYLAQSDFPSLDLVFPHPYFSIFVFYLDHYGNDLPLAHFILGNIFEELVSELYPTNTTQLDNLLVCVVNHDIASESAVEMALTPKLARTQSVLEEHFAFELRAVCSRIARGLQEWSKAYHQATGVLTASLASSEPAGLHFAHALESADALDNLFPHQVLINLLSIHDLEQAKELIDDSLNPAKLAGYSAEQWRHLHFSVLVTLMDNVDTQTRLTLYETEPFFNLDQLLYQQKDARPYFTDILDEIPAPESPEEGYHKDLISQVNAYIEEHFADPSLNLNKLGDVFNITSAYLAKLYKDAEGPALLDVLNQRRVHEAKSILIQRPNTTISNVAKACGFTNANTFIRVFKRFEGITPGRYRDVHKE